MQFMKNYFHAWVLLFFLNNAYTPNEVENGEEGASLDEYKGKMEMQ